MEALYAGLSAWAIEIGIAALAFYLLYREEQKVYKRRAAKKRRSSTSPRLTSVSYKGLGNT